MNEIQAELHALEDDYNVRIVSARDYGSRAWNVHTEDSDHDIGVVFVQDPVDYMTVGTYRQNIDRSFPDLNAEVMGWNIKRFGALLSKSNPTAIEFLQSQNRYIEPTDLFDKLASHAEDTFKPIALMGHYHNMAKANYEKYVATGNDETVKRYLYVLRALTYREFIKKNPGTLPPLDFMQFLENYETNENELDHESLVFANAKKYGNGDRPASEYTNTGFVKDLMQRLLDEAINEKERYNVRGIDKTFVNDVIEEVVAGE